MAELLYLDKELLREIDQNSDWKKLFAALGLERSGKKGGENDWWTISPFNPQEKEASFHIGDKGFYCFSTGKNGGFVQLVQNLKNIDPYAAGRWLVENGISFLPELRRSRGEIVESLTLGKKTKRKSQKPKSEKEKKENAPIRQTLLPLLTEQGEHEQFTDREISKKTCDYLGCGYLAKPGNSLDKRIVFQVRGVKEVSGDLRSVVLTHIGRATNDEQKESGGKWKSYSGFAKTLELYNIDQVLLDRKALDQVEETGAVLVVEGCFDVAKLVEAEIHNVVSTFGWHLAESQVPKFKLLQERLPIEEFVVFYDRDKTGRDGTERAVKLLEESGLSADFFDWDIKFRSLARGLVGVPDWIDDPCKFSVKQLRWLRDKGMI